jgi:hypothetical protein
MKMVWSSDRHVARPHHFHNQIVAISLLKKFRGNPETLVSGRFTDFSPACSNLLVANC